MSPITRVLLTGAAGFIGHHVVEYLLEHTDWDLVLLDRLDTSGNLSRITDIACFSEQKHRVKFLWHDLKAPIGDQLSREIGQVDHVIHLAASSHVDRSIEDPVLFAMDNVVGTTHLLNWARLGGMRHQGGLSVNPYSGLFMNFSTDEVFGPAPDGYAHVENDPHFPSNPYSASKSGQEAMGYAFYVTYGLPVINTHTMNNFGERQHPEKLIPKTIRSILNGEEMPIFAEEDGQGGFKAVGTRYWLDARNTASAILFLLENGKAGEAYNVIGFDELSNLEVAQKIEAHVREITGEDYKLNAKLVDFHKTRPGHDRRYALDGTKLKDMGWVPETDIDQGLQRVVQFTIENKKWL